MIKIKVPYGKINWALDYYYGHRGKTYSTEEQAKSALRKRGFNHVNGHVWQNKVSQKVFLYPLRDVVRRKVGEERKMVGYKPIGFLVTWSSEIMSGKDCRLVEVSPSSINEKENGQK